MNKELREWLGLTWADALVYVALFSVLGMFLTRSSIADATLAAVSIPAVIGSCFLGMKRDPELAKFTNFLKLISYPIAVLLVGGGIAYHYLWFPWPFEGWRS